ncbi:hypothetical protein DNU06_09340 [Putridiphycobacter roseus]|uniref:Uncharacterized protein n=1 Tax=Putridiphycobacter roseus TaxID=2219161 RepID=A0A2W1MZV2_9FLAO|nr:hypothetical protein [Putridiphycobacter roseus]PZE16944.1 hypothetical protein DNU06_09340 [Putridiphycobacter roseus]
MENLPPNEVLKNLKKKSEVKRQWQKIAYARYTMYVISAFCILSAIVFWSESLQTGQMIVFYTALTIGGVFIGLGIWTKKQPKIAIILAMVVFILPFILAGIGDQSTIFEGVWWKIIILVLLLRGLLSVKHISNQQKREDLIDDFEL